jgi:hypothetical protein
VRNSTSTATQILPQLRRCCANSTPTSCGGHKILYELWG